MDNTYAPDAWRRLGKVLEARRAELGYGFRSRERFLRDRGGPPPSLKTIARLERGERAGYPDGTVRQLEVLYALEAGSIEAVLRGGDPVPAGRPRLAAVPPLPDVPADGDIADAVIGALLESHPDKVMLRKIWDFPAPREERLDLLRGWLRRDDEAQGAGAARRPGS